MPAGVAAGRLFQSGARWTLSPASLVRPVNARPAVSISKSTQPKAQMSVRRSTGRPRACSGLMYAGVPKIAPGRVTIEPVPVAMSAAAPARVEAAGGSSVLAMPKSSTLTMPSGRTFTFAGLRSRWTIPWS